MSLFDTFTVRVPRPRAVKRRLGGWFGRQMARVNWLWPAGLLLPAAMALVLAGIAHIVSILAMPALAENNAFARLSEIVGSNDMKLLPDPTPNDAVLPMQDPAFISAVCLYDLNDKPLKVRVPATANYTSVSFYTDEGLAFYALSDQAAGKVIELDLMNADQKAALPEDEEITAADRLVIESPSEEGIVLVRAHVPDRGMREVVRRQLEAATCTSAN
ncbi:DUF1254 domain-containing protein [Xanthobacter agilis]|uniref:Membrane protein n=1 Tax=Xanthobacter agilis TaxID=47492 RepID=A0ABU0LDJ7_XANAG|nr:DUF1254 domain-containing protein [Xanthobacter agilis]MDQ0505222.1 putative membrane protein [Xanthobacter agilis]